MLTTSFYNINYNIIPYIHFQPFKSPPLKKTKHFHPFFAPNCLINAQLRGRLAICFISGKYWTYIYEISYTSCRSSLISRGCKAISWTCDDENPRHAKFDVTNKAAIQDFKKSNETQAHKFVVSWHCDTRKVPHYFSLQAAGLKTPRWLLDCMECSSYRGLNLSLRGKRWEVCAKKPPRIIIKLVFFRRPVQLTLRSSYPCVSVQAYSDTWYEHMAEVSNHLQKNSSMLTISTRTRVTLDIRLNTSGI